MVKELPPEFMQPVSDRARSKIGRGLQIKVVVLIPPFIAAAFAVLLSAMVFRRIGRWMGADFDEEFPLIKRFCIRHGRWFH